MSDKKINFALIGCGAIAKKHVAALSSMPEVRIVAVCDVNSKAAQEIGSKNNIPYYSDPHKMLKEAEIDVLDILTPSGTHGKVVLELIGYNKHFVVEKPLALRLEEIDKILEECDKRSIKLFVVQQNRFNPPIQKLKEAVIKGWFGKLVMGTVRVRWTRKQDYYDQVKWRGTWALDGGVLANQASHHIDMLIWMLGDVESVMAKTATQLADIEVEDTAVAILKFTNGALGVIEATTAVRPRDLEGSISILGEKGSVIIGGFFMNSLQVWNFSDPEVPSEDILKNFSLTPVMPGWNHREYFKDVISSIRNGTKALVDGLDGRKSVELISAIYESAETGKEVFLRFRPNKCKLGVGNANS